MKILDKYIMKLFLGSFIYSIILLISIIIIFDLSEKLDNFLDKQVSVKEIIFDYYVNFAPYYLNMFMYLFIFISVIFFTSKLAARSEIIAILSSGVSYHRMMLPYFMSALILAIFSFLLGSYIIPPANKVRLDFENKYINGTYYNSNRNIHKQIAPGVFIYIESYKTTSDIAYSFSIEKFEGKKLVSKLMSDYCKWDSVKQTWVVHNYYIREYGTLKDVIKEGRTLDTAVNMTPQEFKQRLTAIETLTTPELNKYIEIERMAGSENLDAYLIEKYKRWTFPFSSFILTLIGVSLSTRKKRGGTGINIGIGLGLSFTFILFLQLSTQYALNSSLHPLLAVWIPNLIYLVIGIILYVKAPK